MYKPCQRLGKWGLGCSRGLHRRRLQSLLRPTRTMVQRATSQTFLLTPNLTSTINETHIRYPSIHHHGNILFSRPSFLHCYNRFKRFFESVCQQEYISFWGLPSSAGVFSRMRGRQLYLRTCRLTNFGNFTELHTRIDLSPPVSFPLRASQHPQLADTSMTADSTKSDLLSTNQALRVLKQEQEQE